MNNRHKARDRGQGDSQQAATLYQKEPKIYPREVSGRYARLRVLAVWLLLGLFYAVAWIQIDGQQLVLFDLPARKFHLFGLTFWPQDFIYLALILICAGLSLFFFTALAGRLWCGYACPQTVWTEAFLYMERLAEGNRHKRMKLDKAPWSAAKLGRKSLKQLMWISFALWTGITFVGYFTPIDVLVARLWHFETGPWETFWVFFYGLATYGNAGYLREQVCKYMCPYARFQGAMFDHDTLVISYDSGRGEPRGGRKRGTDPAEAGLGDCIDCSLCVQVCPTGIDIRQGLQYECIACAACVDVCNSVMDKMEYPRGLIRYTTERQLETGTEKARVLRPRVMIYAGLLLVVMTSLLVSITQRVPLRMELIRDRNALYRLVEDDRVNNVYAMKVVNMTDADQSYRIEVSPADLFTVLTPQTLQVSAGSAQSIPLEISAPGSAGQGGMAIEVRLVDEDNPSVAVSRDSRFFLPADSGRR